MQNLQPMERRWLADIFPISKALLNQAFGDEPSPLHFKFQAASASKGNLKRIYSPLLFFLRHRFFFAPPAPAAAPLCCPAASTIARLSASEAC